MFINVMICSNDFLEAQSIDNHFSCNLLLTGTPATFNAAAWQFLLSRIWSWVIRTFRISNFEGCLGEACPVSWHLGSALLMLCLTHVKTKHICRDVSNWHPPPLSPFCHLTLFLSHVTNRGTRITLATHSAHTRSASPTRCSVQSWEGCGGGPRSWNCYSSNPNEAALLRWWHKFIFFCGCGTSVKIVWKTNLKETAESPMKINFTNFIF